MVSDVRTMERGGDGGGMTDLATDDRRAVALSFMKRASRDTFALCADLAETMAADLEKTPAFLTAPNALRLLAEMFRGSARRK
jgi:hypothetical protein